MTIGVGELAARNADALDRALRAAWSELNAIDADDERRRRADVLALIEGYTSLLRQPVPGRDGTPAATYSFKLVLPDGRWWVYEKELPAPPSQGDVVVFEGRGGWRVEAEELVGARPAGKSSRAFFVCAPAA
jgi:hypothetical protein